ncbi:MAG: glycosyltransferase [Promethearchaeota archaeon]
MNIAVVKENINMDSANNINTLKHSKQFSNLGHNVFVLAISRFIDFKERLTTFNIKKKQFLYNKNIKIRYFRGGLGFFMSEFSVGNNKISNFFYYYNPFHAYLKFLRLFPKIFNVLDPEIQIFKYCLKKKFNLVYCRETFKVAIYNILHDIPTIIECHHEKLPPELLKWLIKLKEKKAFKGIITISEVLKKNYIKQGIPENKILVEEDAVELEQFEKITNNKEKIRKKLNLPLNKKIIMYTGKLRYDRGIETILQAANLLDSDKFCFYLLGGNKYRIKKWKNYIKKHKINADISILKFIPNNIIPYYLKSADILLCHYSIKCKSMDFASPLKLFEYMASKTPIIATKLGRITEICKDTELLFIKPDDPIDLCNKIKLLIDNHELKKKLINNAYKIIKKYTYKKRCQKIINFIK